MNSPNPSKPAKPWQSKLTPYTREIAAWRGQTPPKPYSEIAVLLADKHGLSVHPDTVHSFVKARSKVRPKHFKVAQYFLNKGEVKDPDRGERAKPDLAFRCPKDERDGAPSTPDSPPKFYPLVNPSQL